MHQFSLDCTTLLLLSAFAQIPNRQNPYNNKVLSIAAEYLLYVFLTRIISVLQHNTTQRFQICLKLHIPLVKKLMQAIRMANQFNK